MNKIIVIDFESGGILPTNPNIQIAAIAVDEKWNELDSFERKIRFDPAKCHPDALKLNHYEPEAWKDAMEEIDAFHDFAAFLSKHATMEQVSRKTGRTYFVARLAAFNYSFDKDRLWAMAQGNFVPAYPLGLCILQRSLWFALDVGLPVENFKIATVATALGISVEGAHDALADVRISASVARKIEESYAKRGTP